MKQEMFRPELEVVSIEVAKKLKEFGYPQYEGGWYWVQIGSSFRLEFIRDVHLVKEVRKEIKELYKAPTSRELEDCLPAFIEDKFLVMWKYADEEGIHFITEYEKVSVDEGRLSTHSAYHKVRSSRADSLAEVLMDLLRIRYLKFVEESEVSF